MEIDAAASAWILTATALVLFMTLPGLALFYAGLVRVKNALSVMMHCVAITCLISVLWLAVGYSLSFAAGSDWLGDMSKAFLATTTKDSASGKIPETLFFMFQMTFAIITPGLIVGAYVERIKFQAVLLFTALWSLIVYAPVAHWVWGGGILQKHGVMDFAGGLVVHATAGIASLVIAGFLGRRDGFPRDIKPPHNPGMTMMGAGMLWVGWYGFNGGSALAADGSAAMAITVTHISASAAGLVWAALEWIRFKRPSMVGMVTGVVAGLATVTPASGFIGPMGGLIIGVVSAIVCHFAVEIVRHRFRIDDSLDVFAVHGVGGILGTLMVAVLASEAFGGGGYAANAKDMASQFMVQAAGVGGVVLWSAIATTVIVIIVRATVGLRAPPEQVEDGLDLTQHGERAHTP